MAKVDEGKMKLKKTSNQIEDEKFKLLLNQAIDLYSKEMSENCISNFYSLIGTKSRNQMNEVLMKYKNKFSQFDDDEDKITSNQ